jgi:uncharacterized membrane protein
MRSLVRHRRRDDDGVIAVVTALIMCFVLVPLASFAVDIGVQRVATRDMQAVADVVALDLSRQLDGRTYSQLQPHLQTWASTSAARNVSMGRARTVTAELGIIDESKYTPTNPDAIFVPVTTDAGGVPTAVRVTASARVDFSIHGGSGGVTRTAIGRSDSSACFKIGSYALNLNTQKSTLLNALVGDALDGNAASLSALSYTGLAGSSITLTDLAAAMHLGTTDDLFKLDNLSLNTLFQASATALSTEGGSAASVALLNTLASANLSGLAHIKFSDLVSIDAGAGSALATSVNVLDLVAGSAFLANGTNALAVPSISAGVPNVAGVSASLHIIQAPVLRCGHVGSTQKTSQVTLDMTVNVSNMTLLGMAATSKIVFHVDLAQATGTLTKILCGPPADGIDVSVASSLSQLSTVLTTSLKLLGVVVANTTGSVSTLAPAATSTVQIRIPPNAYDQPVSSGSGVVLPQMSSGNVTTTATGLGALPLGVTTATISASVYSSIVTPTLNPLTTNLNTNVIAPISKLLGLELAGADVFAVQKPTCNDVSLVG